jgi:dihydrolipoamide dehydrogenase
MSGMQQDQVVKVPDVGDITDMQVIEILVVPGDQLDIETPLLTLESDKATMDVPSPIAGTVTEVLVAVGESVSTDSPIVRVRGPEKSTRPADSPPTAAVDEDRSVAQDSEPATVRVSSSEAEIRTQLVVLGAGPGGYTAAFRAADLGLDTVLVDSSPTLGGVCLNVGCIPSKALLHAARVIEETTEMATAGLDFGSPTIHREKLVAWKNSVVEKLTDGLNTLSQKRKVTVINGHGGFTAADHICVTCENGKTDIAFEQAIIAAGSEPIRLPDLPDDPRIIDSTGALALENIPNRLLIIGGGIIGLEMATVYQALGSLVTVAEMADQLMPGVDPDLVRPLNLRLKKRCQNLFVNTRVSHISAAGVGLDVTFEREDTTHAEQFDQVLVAVGRQPNGHLIGAENAGITVDDSGFIAVDRKQKTNVDHIFACGDIVGPPMLAHKATHEGKVAAEVAAGLPSAFDARLIPSVAYTDPEIAWVGLTETDANSQGIEYKTSIFPWAASGRALGLGRPEGLTKLLFEPRTRRLLGAGIVGVNAGDLIAEACLAIEMQCEAQDIALTIHPHPTLSETLAFAAEVFEGTITDLYLPRKN